MTGSSKIAWTFSASLHAALVVLMFFGPSLRPVPRPELPTGVTMEAVVIDAATLTLAKIPVVQPNMQKMIEERREIDRKEQMARDQAARDKAARDEQQRQLKVEAEQRRQKMADQKAAEEQALRVEQQRQAKRLEEQRVKKLADEKAAARRIKKAAEAKTAREKAAREKAAREEQQRLAKEAAEKAAQEEQQRLAKEAAEKAEREEQQRLAKIAEEKEDRRRKKAAAARARKAALEKQLREEQEARQSELLAAMGVEEKRTTAVNSGLLAQYQAEIIAKVARNWIRPPSAGDELVCKVLARQIPGGEVVSVEVMECNGDDAVERSIESAVRKSSPLPEPSDPTLFEREIIFTFAPK